MSEPTRRDILKTGAAVITTDLAGCSSTGEGSTQIQQSSENAYEAFNQLTDLRELEEEGINLKNNEFTIRYLQDFHEATPEGQLESDEKNPYFVEDVGVGDVLRYIESGGGRKIAYDLEEDELIQGLEAVGFEETSFEDVDSRDWEMFYSRGEEIESDNSDADSGMGVIMAVKENEAVVTPHERYGLDEPRPETLEVTQAALDAHDDIDDSYPEGDHYENETVAAMRDFVKEEDLEELEDAQIYMGLVGRPEDEIAGGLIVQKGGEEGVYHQAFKINEDHEIADPVDPELNPYDAN